MAILFVHFAIENGNFDLLKGVGAPVSVVTVVGVTINESIESLTVGDSGQLTATVSYSDTSEINSLMRPI